MAESKLTDLIAKLEAATEGSHELNRALGLAIGELHLDAKGDLYRIDRDDGGHTYGGSGDETIITPRWTTSLDAIVALIERKLPGWWVQYLGQTQKGWATRIEQQGTSLGLFCSPTPALALCIALLSALQLQGGSEQ